MGNKSASLETKVSYSVFGMISSTPEYEIHQVNPMEKLSSLSSLSSYQT